MRWRVIAEGLPCLVQRMPSSPSLNRTVSGAVLRQRRHGRLA